VVQNLVSAIIKLLLATSKLPSANIEFPLATSKLALASIEFPLAIVGVFTNNKKFSYINTTPAAYAENFSSKQRVGPNVRGARVACANCHRTFLTFSFFFVKEKEHIK